MDSGFYEQRRFTIPISVIEIIQMNRFGSFINTMNKIGACELLNSFTPLAFTGQEPVRLFGFKAAASDATTVGTMNCGPSMVELIRCLQN